MNASASFLASVLVVTLGIVACEANDGSASTRSQLQAEPTTQPRSDMKIHLTLQDAVLTATLHDTPVARDFASMLPLTLTLEDYAKTEKISDLPRKLKTQGSPAGADPSAGDIAYYAPWGNLALYYEDFGYSDGLILLGKLDGGVEALGVPGSMKVTIERAIE
jgi:hypothetical protein